MAKRPGREPRFIFQFRGWADGWYVLRSNTGRPHTALSAHDFENQIMEWLIEQEITPNIWSYLANGNTGDGPVVPASARGDALCLLFKRPADVLRFSMEFACRGISAETMMDALRREASVHRFVLLDIAIIGYRAMQEYASRFDQPTTEWDDLEDDEQQWHLQLVREYLEHPDWSAARLHQTWVDLRLHEGWTYGATPDFTERQHPWLVGYGKLPSHEQAKLRLLVGVVASLAPSL